MSVAELTLSGAVVPLRTWRTRAALVVGGTALVALCAQISIPLPFTPVPITGQTFAVLLVGTALGARLGVASLALYLAAGSAGAPVYAEGASGGDVLSGPTGGYLVGFLLCAALLGLLAERGWDRRFSTATAAMLAGNVVIYAVGLPWLALDLDTGLEKTLELGLYPFVIGDLTKLYLAAVALPLAWKVVGSRRRRGRPTREEWE